jgi:serine/threonine protein phosphatase PrpC
VACDRLIAMANDQGGPDNITVVSARFEGRGLGVVRATDEVGYREFSPEPPPDEGIVPPEPDRTRDVTQPWPITVPATPADEERKRRAALYMRLIAAVGVLILLAAIWKLFF